MLKQITDKIKSRRGETLVEVLVTILLVGLVSAGFMVVVQTANGMSTEVMELDKQFYEYIGNIEKSGDVVSSPGKVTIYDFSGSKAGIGSIDIDVDVMTGEAGLKSYRAAAPDEEEP